MYTDVVVGVGTIDLLTRTPPPAPTVHFDPAPADIHVGPEGTVTIVYPLPAHAKGDIIPVILAVAVIRPEDEMPTDAAGILALRTAYAEVEVADLSIGLPDDAGVPSSLHPVPIDCKGLFRGRESKLVGPKFAAVARYYIPDAPPPEPEPTPDPEPAPEPAPPDEFPPPEPEPETPA